MSENGDNTSGAQQQAEGDNTCVVCFKQTFIFSIGYEKKIESSQDFHFKINVNSSRSCNHPVCYECSARMRCLCLQNECPICRQDLPKVRSLNFVILRTH